MNIIEDTIEGFDNFINNKYTNENTRKTYKRALLKVNEILSADDLNITDLQNNDIKDVLIMFLKKDNTYSISNKLQILNAMVVYNNEFLELKVYKPYDKLRKFLKAKEDKNRIKKNKQKVASRA